MRDHMKRGAIALAALVSASVLTGCVVTQRGFSQLDNEGKREHLGYAAGESPVFLKILNWQMADGVTAASDAAARYASGSIFGSTAEFTADLAKAKHPNYYVVLAMNLPANVQITVLCDDGPVPIDADTGKLRVAAAFCKGGETLSSSTASGPAPASAGDEAFRKLVRGAMQELFPIEKERDRDETRGIIISAYPGRA